MDIKKLYGELEPGVFEFRQGERNYNPWAAHWYPRYFQIGRLNELQVKRLHEREISSGQVLPPGAIQSLLMLPRMDPPQEDAIKAVKTYLIENMIDELDRRCQEAQGCEAFAWFRRYPHLVRRLGMLHAMDWLVVREGLPEVLPKPAVVVAEVDAVERRYAND